MSPKSTGTPLTNAIPPKKEEPKEEKIIKHELIEEEESDKENELIPTTDFLKDIDVSCEVVSPFGNDSDFVIINAQDIIKQIEVNEEQEVNAEQETTEKVVEKEDQFAFAFDMPSAGNEQEEVKEDMVAATENTSSAAEVKDDEGPIIFDLSDDIMNMEVNDPVEVVPASESVSEDVDVRRYSLEEYMEEEERLTNAKPSETVEEMLLEKKTIAPSPKEEIAEEEVDPINQPISETLKARAAERRAKMKEFNYKFRNNNTIDDIEKEPAYKRAGSDVDSRPAESGLSRTSLGTDNNDDIQLRKNNSFLHDNVD